MDKNGERDYLVVFSTVPGIGAARLKLLMDFFGSAENAWKATRGELEQVGLPKGVLGEFLVQRDNFNVDQYVSNLDKRGIKFITIFDEDYPDRLKNISAAPFVLFYKSQLSPQQINQLTKRKIIGIVGTRKITSYGKEVTAKLTRELVGSGFTIVSGMALGVDGVAHGTSVNCGGVTIAVLGAGVDIVYPQAHRDLYNRILEYGGVIASEVAPEKTVIRGIFPARNRIISGLSEAVLVTEGAIDSGSLITARAALEQGREVFAVPGPINSAMAEGTNYLLKQGAKLVTDVSDILETLGYQKGNSDVTITNGGGKLPTGDNPEEQKIINFLVKETLNFDELVNKTGILSAKLSSILSVMEIKGKIKNEGLKFGLC